jgi:glycosyltransferase involved in cell wall biosynthesis
LRYLRAVVRPLTCAPAVSVIVPAFNRVKYLREAVESVLSQTHTDWELVIADDGSDDETRAYLSRLTDPRIRTLWLRHGGNPAAARNAAIREARGRYLAFLDSDDAWLPEKLQRQIDLMRQRPDRRWSYTRDAPFDERGQPFHDDRIKRWVPYEGKIVEALLKIDAVVSTASVVAERSLVEEAGGFDEGQRFGEDYDLWLRLAMLSEVSVSSEALVRIRVHTDNYGSDRIAAYRGWIRLYGKMAGMVPDRRLRSLCRRRRGESALVLAGLYGDRGDRRAVARTLCAASIYAWPDPAWWLGASKAMLRPSLPSWVRSIYGSVRGDPAGSRSGTGRS